MTPRGRAERRHAKRARELNDTIRYTMWSVFRVRRRRRLPATARRAGRARSDALFEQLAGKDVVVRGTYDVAGLRADAD